MVTTVETDHEPTSQQRLLAAAELLLAVAIILGANLYDIVPVSETPWLVAIGWLSLRWRGLGWRDLGLRAPANWGRTVAAAVAIAALYQLASELLIEPAIEWATGSRANLSGFAALQGNLPDTLLLLALVWTLAAFGEEMAYRGYVLERAAAIAGHTPAAYAAGVAAVSILFGLGHYYQGLAGMAGSTISGLLFGVLYLASGRNLWLPILTHGFSDTIGLALIYFGLIRVT